MALINRDSFERIEKERNSVYDKVAATYKTFTINENRYLQIDTYGRLTRKDKNKVSQSIQIDEGTAKELYDVLRKGQFKGSFYLFLLEKILKNFEKAVDKRHYV